MSAIPLGWKCPECRVVHAPGVKECRCVVGGGILDFEELARKEQMRREYDEMMRRANQENAKRYRPLQYETCPAPYNDPSTKPMCGTGDPLPDLGGSVC